MLTRRHVVGCLRLTLLGLAVSAAVARSSPAKACTPACPTSVAVPNVSSIAGNLVSFEVTLDDPETLSLATAGGELIPTQIVSRAGDRLFEPVVPLAAGTNLVLTYTVCPGNGASTLGRYEFTTAEPSAIELRPAELAVVERGVVYPERGDRAMSFVRLRYTPPDARGNAGHLFEHRASVDGQATFVSNIDGGLGVEVYTVCNQYTRDFTAGMCGGLYSVPPGEHVVEVQSNFLGEAADPEPVRLTIETRCPGDMALGGESDLSAPDDGSDGEEVGVGGVNPNADLAALGDGRAPDIDTDSTTPGSREAGCAFRPANAAGGAGVFGLLLLLARRRRSRH